MTYSREYLEGLKEGRAALKQCATPEEIASAAKVDLDFCDRVSECAHSATQQDYMKGLRDFWTHHLAKH